MRKTPTEVQHRPGVLDVVGLVELVHQVVRGGEVPQAQDGRDEEDDRRSEPGVEPPSARVAAQAACEAVVQARSCRGQEGRSGLVDAVRVGSGLVDAVRVGSGLVDAALVDTVLVDTVLAGSGPRGIRHAAKSRLRA